MGRALSENIYNDLMTGCLKEVLDTVHNDTTLIMELRGNSVIIYYRGGALFTIDERPKGYQVSYNSAYWEIKKKYPELSEQPSIRDIVDKIALYKDQMDYHMANAKRTLEKQSQQRIVLENNILGKVSSEKEGTTGDYFILDIEYAYQEGEEIDARFDAIALNFPSTGTQRKKRNKLGLSFVEIKYYDGSMTGRSGIQKHINDFLAFVKRPEYHDMCRDMEKLFYQKCMLGLIPSYTSRLPANEDYYRITIDDTKVDFVFMFANRDPDSTLAKRELQKSIEEHGEEAVREIYVSQASDVGYIMFRYADNGRSDRYIPIREYI